MSSMGSLPAAGQTEIRMTLIYVFTSAAKAPLHWQPLGQSYCVSLIGSVPRIPDKRVARPEYHHQHNTQHAQHGENRLVQDDPDHAGPEPRRGAFDPGPEGLLAGLVDVVPELAEPGEPQALIGDPARPVVAHEVKSAGPQQ